MTNLILFLFPLSLLLLSSIRFLCERYLMVFYKIFASIIFFAQQSCKFISFRYYIFLFIFDFVFFYIKKSPKIKFIFGDKKIYNSNSKLVLFNYFYLTTFCFPAKPILLLQLFFDNFEDTGGTILNIISFYLPRE